MGCEGVRGCGDRGLGTWGEGMGRVLHFGWFLFFLLARRAAILRLFLAAFASLLG